MLSVALKWQEPSERAAASAVVDEWRLTRQGLLANLPPLIAAKAGVGDGAADGEQLPSRSTHGHLTWAWAGTTDGMAALRGAFAEGSSRAKLLEQFLDT